jgi:YVTN family beta-propeller protein
VLIPDRQSMATIDLRTRTISRTIHVAPGPIEVLTHRFRTVSVLSGTAATVADFDVLTGQEGKAVAVGAQPVAMTESETTKTLWVANKGDNTVTLIDSELPRAATIRVGRAPAAISALGAYGGGINVIVANHDDHTITTILLTKFGM